MNDSLLSLAFTIFEGPGTYALLLGSGLSRGAGVPTGWEIVQDLIRRIAALRGEDPGGEPEVWYRDRFGSSPQYDTLLEALGATATERSAILRRYFEPSEGEQEKGLKRPTPAHRSIAQLAKAGYIRVLITTNFDRLLEAALEEDGVVPTVISSVDAIKGAPPIIHSRCTLVKVNGDYRDIRIRNTPAELEDYPEDLDRYLDSILDQFGLIVCGWSADWDAALRNLLLRSAARRYALYWTTRRPLEGEAKRLCEFRGGRIVTIKDADTFFRRLLEKVEALAAIQQPHPLSAKLAVTTLKKYLAEDKYRIVLEDLVLGEVERAFAVFRGPRFPGQVHDSSLKDAFRNQLRGYETEAEVVLHLSATLGWYGDQKYGGLLSRALERWGEIDRTGGQEALVQLRRYPALLLAYAGGIASVGARRYGHLRTILRDPKILGLQGMQPLLASLYPTTVLDEAKAFLPRPDADREHTAGSNHVFETLRPILKTNIPSDIAYERAFDIFEFLLGLTYVALKLNNRGWAPVGCFGWRAGAEETIREFLDEAGRAEQTWALLREGVVATSYTDFHRVLKEYQTHLDALLKHWFSVLRSPGGFLQAYENGLRNSPIGTGGIDTLRA